MVMNMGGRGVIMMVVVVVCEEMIRVSMRGVVEVTRSGSMRLNILYWVRVVEDSLDGCLSGRRRWYSWLWGGCRC